MSYYLDHLERLQEGVADTYSLTSLSNWVEKYAYLDGGSLVSRTTSSSVM